jgi:hypothetical protein
MAGFLKYKTCDKEMKEKYQGNKDEVGKCY